MDTLSIPTHALEKQDANQKICTTNLHPAAGTAACPTGLLGQRLVRLLGFRLRLRLLLRRHCCHLFNEVSTYGVSANVSALAELSPARFVRGYSFSFTRRFPPPFTFFFLP